MTFYTGNLFEIQIENSSICNAACPQCIREHRLGDKSWLNETYLGLDFFKKIPDEVYNQIKMIFFCGNLGDPCAAPNFLEVCKFVKSKNPNLTIKISTNGGLRSKEFWAELATIVGDRGEVIFAIDGLETTNHIYRVNVRWEKVIENVKSFTAAGGKPYWQYITFRHNQHQVEEARQLAADLGFQKFIVKPSHRFAFDTAMGIEHISCGVKIEPPEEEKFTHKVVFHRTPKTLENLKEDSNNIPIECDVVGEYSSLYIDHEGQLWPCCYLHAGKYYAEKVPYNLVKGWHDIWHEHGKEKINLKINEWNDILNGEFFSSIKKSWTDDYNGNRIITCAITCGAFNDRINIPEESHNNVRQS
jgi:MoaA/NifB/PqqE/SkfB family radical SAM enzyme